MSHTLCGNAVFVRNVRLENWPKRTDWPYILCVYCSWNSINKCVIDTAQLRLYTGKSIKFESSRKYGHFGCYMVSNFISNLAVRASKIPLMNIWFCYHDVLPSFMAYTENLTRTPETSCVVFVSSSVCQLEWPYLTKFRVTQWHWKVMNIWLCAVMCLQTELWVSILLVAIRWVHMNDLHAPITRR